MKLVKCKKCDHRHRCGGVMSNKERNLAMNKARWDPKRFEEMANAEHDKLSEWTKRNERETAPAAPLKKSFLRS